MAWGSEGSPHVCFRFVWYILVSFSYQCISRKSTPVGRKLQCCIPPTIDHAYQCIFRTMLKAVQQAKLKKCEGQRRSRWQWRTAQPVQWLEPFFWPASLPLAGATYPPSHLHTDLRALPWLFSNQKNEKMPKLKVHFSLSLFDASNPVTKILLGWPSEQNQ